MATEVAHLTARLDADTGRFDRAIDRSGRGFQKVGAVIGKAALAAGAAVATGLAVTAKIGFDEFIEGQRVMAQTNAVIKSTGGVANVTAKHVSELAESLMKKSGVDDEAIASGQNMLLTFKEIQNQTGKGNNIFDQATKATLDLSVAMGKDMSDSAIMVGKALNDPVRGLTAMRRVGIQFTEAQEDQIKKMVESGDVMGAQKVILKELESQFGGSAEAAGQTFGGQMNILKETFSNTAGEIVGRFIPIIVRVANWLLPKVTQALDFVFEAITGIIAPFTKASETFGHTGNEAYKLGAIIKDGLGGAWKWIKANVLPIILDLRDIFTTAVKRIGAVLADHEPQLRRIWERAGKALQLLWTIAKPILSILFTEILPRVIGIAIEAIDELTGWIEEIIKTGKSVKEWFAGTFVRFWERLWEDVKDLFNRFALWIQEKALRVVLKILEPFSHLPGKLGGWARDAKDRVNAQLGKIEKQVEDIEEAARRTANKKYNIHFVTNAARVKSDIEDLRSGLFTGFGGGGDGVVSIGVGFRAANPGGLSPTVLDELGLAQSMGLQLTSGYRPGSVTSTGNPSLHGIGKAIDVAGSRSQMAAFFRAIVGRSGIRELLYSPIGGWYGGGGIVPLSGSVLRDHFDHVHVGVFDKGGWLKPGWNLAGNFTGKPERVGGGGDVHFHLPNYMGSKQEVMSWLRNAVREFERRNGRPAFGG